MQDVHMSTLARYIGLMYDTQEPFKELEEMEQDVHMSTLARYIGLMADTQEPQTEIDQQLKLVVEYRHMVRNINIEHIKQQIKEELQIKNVQQHQARDHGRSKPRSANLTANMLDGRGLDTESEARFNQFIEVQHRNTELFSWHVGLKKSQKRSNCISAR